MIFKLIPLPYRIAISVALVTALVVGPFWYGHTKGYDKAETKYKGQIEQLVTDATLLQSKLDAEIANIKVEIVTEYVDRVRTVKEKEYVYIKQAADVVPNQCELSDGWVYLHDASARGYDADTTRSSDDSPSGVEDNQALGRVVENYSTCEENRQQLIALQQFVREAQAAVEEANRKAQDATKKKK